MRPAVGLLLFFKEKSEENAVYEIVRPEFFAHIKEPALTVNVDKIGVNQRYSGRTSGRPYKAVGNRTSCACKHPESITSQRKIIDNSNYNML